MWLYIEALCGGCMWRLCVGVVCGCLCGCIWRLCVRVVCGCLCVVVYGG